MLYFVLLILLGTLVSWVSLIIVMPIAQRLADFAMPPMAEAAWKLAVVAFAANALSVALAPVHFILAWIVPAIVFWYLLVKWFSVDVFGAIIIMVISWVVRLVLGGVLMAALAGLH